MVNTEGFLLHPVPPKYKYTVLYWIQICIGKKTNIRYNKQRAVSMHMKITKMKLLLSFKKVFVQSSFKVKRKKKKKKEANQFISIFSKHHRAHT